MQQPTHGAIALPDLQALLKYFRETAMPYDMSEPFVRALSNAQLITIQPAPEQPQPDAESVEH